MAQRVITTLLDDLDETGQTEADETVEFALDGASYSIDLSEDNAERLRDLMAEFIGAARRTPRAASRTPRAPRTSKATSAPKHNPASRIEPPARTRATLDPEQSKAIRTWANRNGHKVSLRGRISAEIIDAFNAAN